jgi:general secretion pathway protein C
MRFNIIALILLSASCTAKPANQNKTPQEPPKSQEVPNTKPEAPNTKPEASLIDGIEKTGEFSYTAEREKLSKFFDSEETVSKEATFSPVEKDGAVTGLKVFGVRATGVFAALGLKNGDVLQTLNGTKIDSLETATTLAKSWKTINDWKVGILRSGAEIELAITFK